MGSEENLLDLLNRIMELDQEATEAYRAAVQRVADSRDRGRIVAFLDDHLRHMEDLSALLRDLGGEPASAVEGDGEPIRREGNAVIFALFGDRLILEALKRSETDMIALYEGAIARGDLPQSGRAALYWNFAGERRHRSSIVDRLDAAEGLLRL